MQMAATSSMTTTASASKKTASCTSTACSRSVKSPRSRSTYDRFLRREIEVPGKDFCDMAGDYGRDPVGLLDRQRDAPAAVLPARGRATSFERADALTSPQQLLRRRHGRSTTTSCSPSSRSRHDAVFAWHQDMAYWPATDDRRTATFWLAVDDSTLENGCMRFVPATTHEDQLRPHAPVFGGRGESHALGTELRDDDEIVPMPIPRGDCTVHNERVMHGSGGNNTDGFRRAYILAYRSAETDRHRARARLHPQPQRRAEVLDSVGVDGETT